MHSEKTLSKRLKEYLLPAVFLIFSILLPCSSKEFSEEIQSIYSFTIATDLSNVLKCSDQPDLAERLISTGRELGVRVLIGKPLLDGKDATYEALPGRLGTIIISDRIMAPEVRCKLISHEFIHVLQHLRANLLGVEPLGWIVPIEAVSAFGSLQEAEAYTYQNNASVVLKLLLVELQERQILSR